MLLLTLLSHQCLFSVPAGGGGPGPKPSAFGPVLLGLLLRLCLYRNTGRSVSRLHGRQDQLGLKDKAFKMTSLDTHHISSFKSMNFYEEDLSKAMPAVPSINVYH